MTPVALTVAQVAQALQVSRWTVYDLIEAGRLRAVRIGRGGSAWRIPASELDRFLESEATPAI